MKTQRARLTLTSDDNRVTFHHVTSDLWAMTNSRGEYAEMNEASVDERLAHLSRAGWKVER